MPEQHEIPLWEQIKCVDREISKRQWVYPKLVEKGRMTQAKMESEIRNMQAVKATLHMAAKLLNLSTEPPPDPQQQLL